MLPTLAEGAVIHQDVLHLWPCEEAGLSSLMVRTPDNTGNQCSLRVAWGAPAPEQEFRLGPNMTRGMCPHSASGSLLVRCTSSTDITPR